MKLTYFNILCTMLGLLCISSCSDDMHDEFMDDRPLTFAVSSSWGVGRALSTRSSISDDVMSGSGDIGFTYENYPQNVTVQVDNQGYDSYDPILVSKRKMKTVCEDHTDYYMYDSQGAETYFYIDYMGTNYRFYAWSTLDADPSVKASTQITKETIWNNVPAFGFCDYLYCYKANVNSGHVLIDLKHYTAMLRLFYGYSTKYAKVRNIVLRNVKISSLNSAGTKKVSTLDLAARARFTTIDGALGLHLSTASKAFGYVYVNPDSVGVTSSASTTTKLQLECTYDIYDDDAFDSDGNPVTDISKHRTRKNVTAVSSPFTLKSASISKLEAGKYYDLSVTINPDYLYVLSEHDEKPVTVK